jgi:hypothetical protein
MLELVQRVSRPDSQRFPDCCGPDARVERFEFDLECGGQLVVESDSAFVGCRSSVSGGETMIVPKRRRVPGTQNYRGVWSGLGDASYGQDIPAPTYENCNPIDSACVARNLARDDQWNQAVAAAANAQHLADCLHGQYPASVCYSTFGGAPSPSDSTSQGGGYVAPQPIVKGDDTKVIPGSQVPPTSGVVWPEDSTTGPVFVGATPTPTVTPQGQVVVSSSGTTSTVVPATTASTGFDLSAIPTWGWLAAAGFAFFMFKGGR